MALKVRFAPPKSAVPIASSDVRDGDWARWAGYWWRVSRRRVEDNVDYMVDLENPRGKHSGIYVGHLLEARCG